jgi:hypothetical protein
MSWVEANDRPVHCPCGAVLASPKSLYHHLRNNHPGLTDRERSEMVRVLRSEVVAEAVRKILRVSAPAAVDVGA